MHLHTYTLFIILFICNIVATWKTDHKPKFYGDKIPNRLLATNLRKVQRRIVTLHDYFRTKVSPSASNMLTMKWHRSAANAAERWSQHCKYLIHDESESRHVQNFGTCGQNIFVSSQKVPWYFVLKTWFFEKENFTYGTNNLNHLKEIGHYTQMVWATTHKVGCGVSKCPRGPNGKPFYNYVCNYCPSGNLYDKIGFPYEIGKPCGSCNESCRSKKIRLCTNACNAVDLWANCGDLNRNWNNWLCNDASPNGIERKNNCRATCTCHGKIHD